MVYRSSQWHSDVTDFELVKAEQSFYQEYVSNNMITKASLFSKILFQIYNIYLYRAKRKKLVCPECDATFANVKDRRQHLRHIHEQGPSTDESM